MEIDKIARAQAEDRIHYQLWRNSVFAEWMARYDQPQTKAYHVSLVRQGYDEESAAEFHTLIRPSFQNRFTQITWEQLYTLASRQSSMARLCQYLSFKPAGLKPAFKLACHKHPTAVPWSPFPTPTAPL